MHEPNASAGKDVTADAAKCRIPRSIDPSARYRSFENIAHTSDKLTPRLGIPVLLRFFAFVLVMTHSGAALPETRNTHSVTAKNARNFF